MEEGNKSERIKEEGKKRNNSWYYCDYRTEHTLLFFWWFAGSADLFFSI